MDATRDSNSHTRTSGRNGHDAFERFLDGGRIVHEGNPDETLTRVGPVRTGLGQKRSWYDLDTAAFPKGYCCLHTSTESFHGEPQEQAALRPAGTQPAGHELAAKSVLGAIGLPADAARLRPRPQ